MNLKSLAHTFPWSMARHPRWFVTMLIVLSMFWFAIGAVAAQPEVSSQKMNEVRVVNVTGNPRVDVTTTVLPFAQGVYRGEPLCVDDSSTPAQAVQIAKFGASWPDGSWRYARINFPVRLGAHEVSHLDLVTGTGARPAFAFGDSVLASFGNLTLRLNFGERTVTWQPWELIDEGHLVTAFRTRGRVQGLPMWAELTLEFGSTLNHVKWWLHFGNSDTTDSRVRHQIPVANFVIGGENIVGVVHNANTKVLNVMRDNRQRTRITVTNAGLWGDGESQALSGVLLFLGEDLDTLVAESLWPIAAVATTWPESGAFGPWGYVPEPPAGFGWEQQIARTVDDLRAFRASDPWQVGPHSCAKDPSQTGDQPDFSALMLTAEAHGWATRLLAVKKSIYQEACRPTHLRNADASPMVLSKIKNLHFWNNQVFHVTSPNKLGKETQPSNVHGFHGHDRQHYSINYLTLYALLTGDRWAVSECEHHAELWQAAMPAHMTGNPVIDGMGAARGVGRTLHAASLLYLVTGRQDLAQAVAFRIGIIEHGWRGRNTSPRRPLSVNPPDSRNLNGLFPFTMPWQEMIGARGLDAAARVFDDERADDIAKIVSVNGLNFGVVKQELRYTGVKALRWKQGGAALTPVELLLGRETFSPYLLWEAPGMVVARRSTSSGELKAKADAAIAQLLANFSWRNHEWLAIK